MRPAMRPAMAWRALLLLLLAACHEAQSVVFNKGAPCLEGRRGATRAEVLKDDWVCFVFCKTWHQSARCKLCCLDPNAAGGATGRPEPEPPVTEPADPSRPPPATPATSQQPGEGGGGEASTATGDGGGEGPEQVATPTAAGGETGETTPTPTGAPSEGGGAASTASEAGDTTTSTEKAEGGEATTAAAE